jgi:hypothetical protein
MVRDANGYPYELTAGHCVQPNPHAGGNGSTWYTKPAVPGNECAIGTPIAGEFSRRMDAVVIAAPGACGTMGAGIVEWDTPYEYYPVKAAAAAYIGLYECHMGASSVNQCGTIKATNIEVNVEWKKTKPKEYIVIEHLDWLCAAAIEGDSGGPVQYGNTEWTYVTATVTAGNTARCVEGGGTFAYEIPYAETFIGVHVQNGI